MHAERYRASERADAELCPGFEPMETPAGTGCRHCSGLREDHAPITAGPMPADRERRRSAIASAERADDVQGTLF